MKIGCECGATIHDFTDNVPHKAHVIPDQDWDDVVEAIDDAIEKSGPTAKEKEAACMRIRRLIGQASRMALQCHNCGRLYIDDQRYNVRSFVPDHPDASRELFRSRPAPNA